MCAIPTEDRKSVGSPGTGATAGCEPPYEFWEQNPGPLQEHQMPLTAQPCLQPIKCYHVQ